MKINKESLKHREHLQNRKTADVRRTLSGARCIDAMLYTLRINIGEQRMLANARTVELASGFVETTFCIRAPKAK